MAVEHQTGGEQQDSVWKRALLVIGALVGLGILWFILMSFMLGFVQGSSGVNSTAILATIAAGVLVAPFVHVLFARIVDYTASQM